MSIYKTDKWLSEALDSVVAQDIGFEENVQIILVNDGSPDDSESICLEYQKRYPDNIVYLKKKNGGLSSARNFGLKYREGEYINFFDPDDILELNVLSSVYDFSLQHKDKDFALIAIPLVYFEGQSGLHKKYEYMGLKNRVIDLIEEPYNFILSSASSFYKTEAFDRYKYDSAVHTAEDTDVNMNLFLDTPRIGYVCEDGVQYNYRKRLSGGSMVDSIRSDTRGLTTIVKVFRSLLKKTARAERPEFINQCILYELRTRVRLLDSKLFPNELTYANAIKEYRLIISELPDESISSSKYLHSDQLRYVFFSRLNLHIAKSVSERGKIILSDGREISNSLKPRMKAIDVKGGRILLEFLMFDYGLEYLRLIYENQSSKEVLAPMEDYTVESSHDFNVGNFHISKTRCVRFELPYDEAIYSLKLLGLSNMPEGINVKVNIFKYLPFKLYTKRAAFIEDGVGVSIDRGNLMVYRAGRLKYYMHVLETTFYIIKNFKLLKPARLLGRYKKKYVLINDRPTIAKDNGEALFKYISLHEPHIAKYTYFVLQKTSHDYERLKRIGRVVKKNSLKHKYLFLNSRLILSSHLFPDFILPFSSDDYKFYADVIKRRFVWLQHGITKDDISSSANRFHQGVDGLVVASPIEADIFNDPKYFYKNEHVYTAGFPRFDYLGETSPNSTTLITIMPTWRSYISRTITSEGLHEKVTGFEETEFYKKYAKILNDIKLRNALSLNNTKLQFILHPGLIVHADSFEKFSSDNIEVVKANEIDYGRVFSESDLLITDYSSVFFDFAYTYKPTLFYQFDRDRFFDKHYRRSVHFSYDRDAPGAVIENHEVLVNSILEIMENKFSLAKKYRDRIDKLFLHHDKLNSRRLVGELKKKGYLD